MPHDPGILALVLGAGSALLALVAMIRVACIDIRSLEIDPVWTAFAAGAGLGAVVAVQGPGVLPAAAWTALIGTAAGWLAGRTGRLGQGDIGLFAMVGLVAGGTGILMPVLALSIAFGIAACLAYGLARGKRLRRLFRHMVPVATPVVAALAPAFAWRVTTSLRPGLVPDGAWSAAAVALAGSVVLAGMLAAGALPMAVRRRAVVTKPCGPRGRANQQREETSR